MRRTEADLATPDRAMLQSLQRLGLLGDIDNAEFEALTGGVSSDIWKVYADGRSYCVKRALSRLRVEADWYAPIERNRYEVAWYKIANDIVPGSAPGIMAHDDETMLCVMEYLDPVKHKLWKSELHDGRTDSEVAIQVGSWLGKIHAGAAGDEQIERQFPASEIFQMIRLEPYLEATAARHLDLEGQLFSLSRRTAETRLTMIHGDVSPKNILLGPNGPVFLDAECACIGDPAFDLAFCLNHFLLKCLWTPSAANGFLDCFRVMTSSYLNEVTWEEPVHLEARTASLLPGLLLARVDGKSPVEYVTAETDKNKVRHCARRLLLDPPSKLTQVAESWREEISR